MIRKFPVISLTGPRQSGKTTLLQKAFPDFKYFNLERMDYREMILNDPIGFLHSKGSQVIFDEAQYVPELFSYLQVISDERKQAGQYILSGSQSFLMNEKISQSLAGRTYISHLLPFDMKELQVYKDHDVSELIFKGFYPRLHASDIKAGDFYPSYIQTYIERDIRTLKAIGDLNAFSRFIGLCAGRIGQLLNLTSLANDAGIAVNTAKAWLSLLQQSFIIFLLQPYHNNFNKRLIKAPKIYFFDTGLVCSLLRINSLDMIYTHYLYGALFENLVISEIIKNQYHAGKRAEMYFWRESNGTEIDCILEHGSQNITAIEIKSGQTFNKEFLRNFKNFPGKEIKMDKKLIYNGDQSFSFSGVEIFNWKKLPEIVGNHN